MQSVDKRSQLIVDVEPGLEKLGVNQRLADTPAEAHVRGLFFRLAEQALHRRSHSLVRAWTAIVGRTSRWPFKFYPTRDCIREQAIAAILLNETDPAEALRDMWAQTPEFSPLLRADRFMAILTGREPVRALKWLERNRGMMCDYGGWRTEFPNDGSAIFHYSDEYIWIESAHRGGVEGTLARCGVSAIVTPELDTAYSGRLRIAWG